MGELCDSEVGEDAEGKLRMLRQAEMLRARYSPPHRGGVAAPSRKYREASKAVQTGWSLTSHVSKSHAETVCVSDHPVRSIKGGFASFS